MSVIPGKHKLSVLPYVPVETTIGVSKWQVALMAFQSWERSIHERNIEENYEKSFGTLFNCILNVTEYIKLHTK